MNPAAATNKKKKPRSDSVMKAPGAPKRFKSSYILFFMSVQDNIKKSLPKEMANAPTVSKVVSRLWKDLPTKERAYWDAEAEKEKKRFHREKEAYKGPWTVPKARAKKDPNAPRRNPSAFLLFSNQKRKELKGLYSHLKNTDFSRLLGIEWNKASVEEKAPFLRQEERERAIYKSRMSDWKRNKRVSDAEDSTNYSADTASESLVVSKPSQDEVDDQDSLVIPIHLLKNLRTKNSKSRSSDCKNSSSLEVLPMNDVSLGESSLNNFDHTTNTSVPRATNEELFHTQMNGHQFYDSRYIQPYAIAQSNDEDSPTHKLDSFFPYHTNVMPQDSTFESRLDSAQICSIKRQGSEMKNEMEIKQQLFIESQKMMTASDTRSSTNSVTPPFSSRRNTLIGDAETFHTYSINSMKYLDPKPTRLIKRQGSQMNIEVQNKQPTFTERQAKMAETDTRSSTNTVTPPFSSRNNILFGDAETFSMFSLGSLKLDDNEVDLDASTGLLIRPSLKRPTLKKPFNDTPSYQDSSFQEFDPIYGA